MKTTPMYFFKISLFASVLLSVVLLTPKSFAYEPQDGNVSAILGPFLYKTNFGRADVGYGSPNNYGAGLVALGDLNRNGALEIGLFTLQKVYLKESDSKYIVQSAELLHITMGYRYYINPWWSTSLTFFSGYALGTPETIYSEFSPTAQVDTSAKDNTEYGFDFAVQTELGTFKDFGLVMDARYSLSLTPKEDERSDHFGLLVGIRYLISSSAPTNKKD